MKSRFFIFAGLCSLIFSTACEKTSSSSQEKTSSNSDVDFAMVNNGLDSLDFILPMSEAKFLRGRIPGLLHKLTPQEVCLAKKILSDYIDVERAKQDTLLNLSDDDLYFLDHVGPPYPLKSYVRQYMAFQQIRGLVVWVNFVKASKVVSSAYDPVNWNSIFRPDGGGNNFGQALVDISHKKVIDFELNAPE